MPNETLTLIEPTLTLRDDFCSVAKECLAEGNWRYREAIADFEGFIQLCSDEALGRNLAHGRVPQSTFGWSGTSKGSSVVPDYATLSMRFLKKKEDTSVMTFVRQSGDKDMELCFSA